MEYYDLIELISGTGVADWVRLMITVLTLGYLWTASSRDIIKIGWPMKAGLTILVIRAALDLTDNFPVLDPFPVIGRDDPAHEFYKTAVAGVLGLGLLCLGACWDSVRNWRLVKTLNREARFHAAVLSSLETGVLVLDRDKNVVFVNPRAVNALEDHYKVRGATAPGVAAPVAQGVGGHNPQQGDGEDNPVYFVRERVIDEVEDAEGPLLLRTWWDVTRWEDGQRLSHEFVSAVSHELRTPLTSVNGYLELALDDPDLSGETREHLEIAKINGDRLVAVVGDLLDLSRIEAGAVTYDLKPHCIQTAVAEAARSLEPDFVGKSITLTLPQNHPALRAQADGLRLSQVLTNLLSNACKYTPAGGRVAVNVQASEAGVQLDVQDTGIGIPQLEQARIFTRFFRSSAARGIGVAGTGLGLAITKSLVEGMGGTIWFSSEPGKGSTFSIKLPAAPTELMLTEPISLPAAAARLRPLSARQPAAASSS